jgi:hypothetical protein
MPKKTGHIGIVAPFVQHEPDRESIHAILRGRARQRLHLCCERAAHRSRRIACAFRKIKKARAFGPSFPFEERIDPACS